MMDVQLSYSTGTDGRRVDFVRLWRLLEAAEGCLVFSAPRLRWNAAGKARVPAASLPFPRGSLQGTSGKGDPCSLAGCM